MKIKDYELEYYEDSHTYLCNGIILPSVTQLLATKFGKKYENVPDSVLRARATEGTEVHAAIERYCTTGKMTDIPELHSFLFLSRAFGFEVLNNEVPVILFQHFEPIAAGRLDMVIKSKDGIGIADIKRTSVLDRDYLFYQLNLYRIAYEQSYDTTVDFLAGLHLKENKRRYVPIPINGPMAWEIVTEYMEGK